MDTSNFEFKNIKAFNSKNEFLGYVSKVFGAGTTVTCKLTDYPFQFPTIKARAILRSAKNAYACILPSNKKCYIRTDNITFKMVGV